MQIMQSTPNAGAAAANAKTPRPRIVIVGAGFGGVEAARALKHADADVVLIDRRNFHLFQPLLYQVATAALSPGDIAWPARSVFRRQKNITVLMVDIRRVDVARRVVTDGKVEIPYDFLVLATGAMHSYFGHEEWEAFAPGLKTISDALSLRERLLLAFEHSELSANSSQQSRLVTSIILCVVATVDYTPAAACSSPHH